MSQEDHIWFQATLADHGVEATLEEAAENYRCLMVASVGVSDCGQTIDQAIDNVQSFAGPTFHPAICKQLLEQMLEFEEGN